MKKQVLIIYIILSACIGFKCVAQQEKKIDSLLKLFEKTWSKDADSAYYFANTAYKISNSTSNYELVGKSRVAMASAKLVQGDYATSERLLNMNLVDSISLTDETIGKTLKYLGYTLYNKKNYVKSSQAFLKSISYFKKIEDSISISRVYNGLGMIQFNLKREPKAMENYQNALRYNSSGSTYKDVCTYISTRMNMAELGSEHDQAYTIFMNAIALASQNEADFFIPTIYQQLSHFYIGKNDYRNAIKYAKKALQETRKMNLGGKEQLIYRDIGTAYFLNGQYHNAVENYLKALPNSKMEVRDTIYKRLSMSYYKLNDNVNGEFYFFRFLKHSDSTHQLQNIKTVTEIIEKYESNKKDLEIKILQHENESVTLKNKQQKNHLLLAVFLIALLLITSFAIWQFYKREKEQNEILFVKNQELVRSKGKAKESNEKDNAAEQELNIELVKLLEDAMISELFLDKELTLSKLANRLSTNTTYLSNTINGYYQKKFADFINEQRVNYVLARIERDRTFCNYTIAHIADISGFNSSSAFYIAFKKYTGLTPSYYIKEKLNKTMN
ncbi:helix-turn-helix domain-containing protein [Flagellimonas sp.]|uniref:helix-turn-helix domain-containing protein n=1 Tax=Flagellimonas sp. TaxID=2058762 RepID=UPI003B5009DE